MDSQFIWLGGLGSLLAGLGTGVGALGIFLFQRLSERNEVVLMSSAAGIMLAACFFSLLLPGLAVAETLLASRPLAVAVVTIGLFLGAVTLLEIHRRVPHEHFFVGHEGPDSDRLSRIWLFVIAIAIHNFPEGMTVGVGFSTGDWGKGGSLATGIGIQNMAEGLAVAAVLLAAGYTRRKAFWASFLTGLIEPVGGLFASLVVWMAEPLLPWMLGFAAGAMLFVIVDEIIPETHRSGFKNLATLWLLAGFSLMMFLDAALA